MAVVGNFIGEVGHLRLQGSLMMLASSGALDGFEGHTVLGEAFADFPTQVQSRE